MGSYKENILKLLAKYNLDCSEIAYKRVMNQDGSVILSPILMADELRIPVPDSKKIVETQKILEREKIAVADRLFGIVKNVFNTEKSRGTESVKLEVIPRYNRMEHIRKVEWCEKILFLLEVISPYDIQYRTDIELEKDKILGTRIRKEGDSHKR